MRRYIRRTNKPVGSTTREGATAVATLQALLDDPSLGLSVHAPPPSGPTGEVAFDNVRSADFAADRPWLAGTDLRWTEAPYGRPRPRPDPLLSPAPAALVYALTPQRRDVPDALVTRARAAGSVLLATAPTVGVERLEVAAVRLLAAEGGAGARAGAGAQRYLLRALDSPKPERDLLERLQQLTGGGVVLLAPWGEVLARAGDLPVKGPGDQAARLPEGRMRLGGREARVLRVVADGRLRSLLVAVGGGDAGLPWLELARTLLAVTALMRAAEARGEEARRGALLAEWLAAPQAAEGLKPRLRSAGLDLDNPYAVTVAELGPRPPAARAREGRQPALERLRSAGDELFRSSGLGALSETRGEHCLWVVAGGSPTAHAERLMHALEAAAREGEPVRLGVSLPRRDLAGIQDAYRQAVLAAQAVTGAAGIGRFDAFDPVYWVLTQQPEANLRAFRDHLVGPLQAADDGKLWRTLTAYLSSPEDLQTLAKRLHIHVNTLRYRLKRIEALVGQPLQRPETLAQLHLAQEIDAMLRRNGH